MGGDLIAILVVVICVIVVYIGKLFFVNYNGKKVYAKV